MFKILKDKSKTICVTRGDAGNLAVNANLDGGGQYTFKKGDVIRFRVFKAQKCGETVILKDVVVDEERPKVIIPLSKTDTKIGGVINAPVDYWYNIELNPDTTPHTMIGYDDDGQKIFRLFPKGGDTE